MKAIIFLFVLFHSFSVQDLHSQSVTWERVLTYTDVCELFKVCPTSDGGYVAAGNSRITGRNKMFFIKLNYLGDTSWVRYFDLAVDAGYSAKWIEQTTDKGFIIAGYGAGPNSDAYIVKTDSLGNLLWYKTFGGLQLDIAECVKQMNDNGYVVLINSWSFGPTHDFLVIRTDSLGNTVWSKRYGGDLYGEVAHEIEVIDNSGFIIVGYIRPFHENLQMLRINSEGDTLWSRTYSEYLSSEGYSIDETNDKGFIVAGTCDSLDDNNKKSYVIKTDSLGTIQWSNIYTSNFNEWCFSIRLVNESKYVMCGQSDSLLQNFERAFVRLLDGNGNSIVEKFYRGNGGQIQNAFYSVEPSLDKGFILSGFTDVASGLGYVVKTDSMLNVKPVGIFNNNIFDTQFDFELYQNYPNPFNPVTTIYFETPKSSFVKLTVYDVAGKVIKILINEFKNAGKYDINFDGSKLSSGIYFYKLEAGDFELVRKMILIK